MAERREDCVLSDDGSLDRAIVEHIPNCKPQSSVLDAHPRSFAHKSCDSVPLGKRLLHESAVPPVAPNMTKFMSDPRFETPVESIVWSQMSLCFELAAHGYCETDQKGGDGWHASEYHDLAV